MKKTILILVVLALLVPAAAFAATEFSLGGFIKLDSFWDSTQMGKNMNTAVQRNNSPTFQHGRFQMTAQGSRFNFTIKGPKLWGATTTGFIEMDFDNVNEPIQNASHAFTPRLRHAMFRLNWPETELLMGQYWSFNNEFAPETAQDGGFQFHGQPTHRLPQIRLTQKFAGAWTVAGMIGKPTDPSTGANGDVPFEPLPAGGFNNTALGVAGQNSATPQVQAKLGYEADLWGKAPFYGRPRGFAAQVMGAWQRTRYQAGNAAANQFATFGNNNFAALGNMQQSHQQYLDPWVIQAHLFIPVIPTYSANLAGTASLSAQWYIGQGLAAFGNGRDQDQSYMVFKGINQAGFATYDRRLMNQFGGYVQGQYYFTNQWFTNLAWGVGRNFGVDRSISGALAGNQAGNPVGYKYASNNDQTKLWNEIDFTLWYRPIEALKFGLQYSYTRTDWMQRVTPNNTDNSSKVGDAHRVEFVGFMYF